MEFEIFRIRFAYVEQMDHYADILRIFGQGLVQQSNAAFHVQLSDVYQCFFNQRRNFIFFFRFQSFRIVSAEKFQIDNTQKSTGN